MASLKALSKRELVRFTKQYPDWKVNKRETQIQREFEFRDYVSGLVFMARVTVHAEVANHHPDMTLSYGKVKVALTTHETKSLTKKDTVLAGKINELYQKT